MNITVIGYGNVGKEAARAVLRRKDMTLVGVVTRRNVKDLAAKEDLPFVHVSALDSVLRDTDAALLCTSSEHDTMELSALVAAQTCTVDAFDDHAKMEAHKIKLQDVTTAYGTVAVLGAGWDPGLFSVMRLYAEAFFDTGATQTLWGPGVSAGHSDILRRLFGDRNATEKTVPTKAALRLIKKGYAVPLSATEAHKRVCYLPKPRRASLERTVKACAPYYKGYETEFHYLSPKALQKVSQDASHSGHLYRFGTVGGFDAKMAFSLTLGSNPAFTASVMVTYARAAVKLKTAGAAGAYLCSEIAPALLCDEKAAFQTV